MAGEIHPEKWLSLRLGAEFRLSIDCIGGLLSYSYPVSGLPTILLEQMQPPCCIAISLPQS